MSKTMKTLATAVALVTAGACSKNVDVDKVPVGTEVQVTRDNGALVQGKLESRSPDAVKVAVGPTTRTVPRAAIAEVRIVTADQPASVPAAAKFREVTVPAGTVLDVRLDAAVDSKTSHVEDAVTGTLVTPVLVDGVDVFVAESAVRGNISAAVPAGNVKGRAHLALVFTSIEAYGDRQPMHAAFERTAPSTKASDAKKIGIPAAAGGIIGAIIDGKKGAAIGGAIGGGAGTAVVLTTPGHDVVLPVGTVLRVTLSQAVEVKVPLRTPKS